VEYILDRQLIVVQLTTKSPGAATPRDFLYYIWKWSYS